VKALTTPQAQMTLESIISWLQRRRRSHATPVLHMSSSSTA
jgi:hypothetical protein